jgi:hypothetical protein
MYVLENLKKTLEKVTGVGKPSASSARRAVRRSKPHTLMFKDDGSIPNNAHLPFLLYRGAVGLTGSADPAALLEELFQANDWGDSWRNGIYEYVHYHSRTHEVLGIARAGAVRRQRRQNYRAAERGRRDPPGRDRPSAHFRKQAAPGRRGLSAFRNLRRMHALARASRARLEIDPEGADACQRSRLRQRRTPPGVMASALRGRACAFSKYGKSASP